MNVNKMKLIASVGGAGLPEAPSDHADPPPQNTPALLLNEAWGALERLLQHAGIADQHAEDIDGEDHLAESSARAVAKRIKIFLSTQGVSSAATGVSLEDQQFNCPPKATQSSPQVEQVSAVQEKNATHLGLPGAL